MKAPSCGSCDYPLHPRERDEEREDEEREGKDEEDEGKKKCEERGESMGLSHIEVANARKDENCEMNTYWGRKERKVKAGEI